MSLSSHCVVCVFCWDPGRCSDSAVSAVVGTRPSWALLGAPSYRQPQRCSSLLSPAGALLTHLKPEMIKCILSAKIPQARLS